MSVNTFSTFYTFPQTDDTNRFMPFSEGAGQLNATQDIGAFTITETMGRVKTKMDAAGGQVYTVSLNRPTRLVTISAPGVFELLVLTGTNAAASIYTNLGFTGADRTGASSYTGNIQAGSVFEPQFELQNYTSKNDFQKNVDPVVKISASGVPEVVRFGISKFYEFNVGMISNLSVGDGKIIKNNPTGHEDAIAFMEFAVAKGPLEFMPNIATPNAFDKVILETTNVSDRGTDFKLIELLVQSLPGIYETGNLVFRVVG